MNFKHTKFSVLVCVAMAVCGCKKTEVLTGQRENLEGITYTELNVSQDLKNIPVTVQPSLNNNNELTDLYGNQQHLAINHILSKHPKIKWCQKLGKRPIVSNILVLKNCIFMINGNGNLCCLDKRSGKLIWEKEISKQPRYGRFSGGITTDGRMIYAVTNTSEVSAFDITNQKVIWKKTLDDMGKGAPVCACGKVIVSTASNRTYALNPKDGSVLWGYKASKEQETLAVLGTPAVYKDNIICVYSNGDVVSLRISDGSVIWSDVLVPKSLLRSGGSLSLHISASPIVIGDKVLVINAFSTMSMFNAQTGNRIWSKDIGSVSHPAVIDHNWMFMLSDTDLLCMSIKNGDIKWKINDSKRLIRQNKDFKKCTWYGPLVVNGQVWIFGEFANILKYDISNGKFLGETYLHHVRYRDTPVIVGNTMYAPVYGKIYAIG